MTRSLNAALASAVSLLAIAGGACQNRPPASDVAQPDLAESPVAGSTTRPSPATDDQLVSIAHGLPTGRPCRLHLRRDAMGMTGLGPLPLQTVSPAARSAQLDGTIDLASEQWIVLRARERTYWLPTGVILAVEYLDGN
jgi:hypothetical protein